MGGWEWEEGGGSLSPKGSILVGGWVGGWGDPGGCGVVFFGFAVFSSAEKKFKMYGIFRQKKIFFFLFKKERPLIVHLF